ncbi:SusC/RagA family TonB-linked outer membrane protein [Arenibacter latericius]|uniref:SusC/RagA family TonB-linked outer membrane protein n=1 Tax=Arenibacter latericius TaxID=86104 RepID=UPI00040114F2|nr:TonB-dependent receptor [Arenibacter latericius]
MKKNNKNYSFKEGEKLLALKSIILCISLISVMIASAKPFKTHLADKDEILPLKIHAQMTISGTVSDREGAPLPGASIVEKGTTNGTQTDFDGNYDLNISNENAIIVISYIGYASQEIAVNGQAVISINLEESAAGLDEVVVVGYGTQRKINLTGAVDVVNSEEIANRSVTNVTEALQGISPNLNITSNGWDGEPGGSKNINIRGMGSLNGNDGPYILVDGVPMDLNSVNPNDIESFSILKDAAASAIYGSRAAFGVILITTKRGEKNKLKVNYSNNFSFSSPIGLPHMANSIEYMTAHDQAQINAGLSRTFTTENYDRVKQYMEGNITDETWLRDDENNWHGNDIWSLSGNGNNDWMYIYYDNMVLRQKHDVSFSGGSDKVNFFVGGGFFDQPDELKFGDQFYKRFNVTANLNAEITNWLSFNFNSKFINERKQYFNPGQGWSRDVQYHNFYRTNPFRPLYLPNGEYSAISYINEMIDGGKEKHYDNQYIATVGFNLKLLDGWDTKIQYSYKNNSYRMDNTRKEVVGHLPDGSAYPIANGGSTSYFASQFARNDYQLFTATTSYLHSIKKHNLNLLLGYEFDLNQYNSLYGRKTNLLNSNLPAISTSTGEQFLDDTKNHWGTQGVFGRFTYNYDEKYLFEANVRYDASSRFSKDSRWGFFPSVSAGYNISKEDFWSPLQSIINTLKIRGSWGSLGNQNVDNYLYLSTLGINTNLYWLMNGERPDYITSPGLVSGSLTWETSSTLDIGFEASFLNNRLTSTFDYFRRTTTDMFGPANALPRLLGTGVPKLNNASLETNGFELSLAWRDYIGEEFSYNLRFNLSDNISKIKKYNNPTNTLTTWYEGKTVGEIWGLDTNGLYQTQSEADTGADQTLFWPTWGPGDIAYRDLDGDNVISRGTWTKGDSGDYRVIGNNTPRFNYGLAASADWNGFDISFLLQGVGKRDYAFAANDANFYGFNANFWWDMNVYRQTVDYWRPADESNYLGPNINGYYPKPYLSLEDKKNKEISTRYMQDASYLRLKSLTFGYTLPSNITENIGIGNARIYVSGENLLTFTKLTKLMDPEGLSTLSSSWGAGKIHPLRKVYAVGLNITF